MKKFLLTFASAVVCMNMSAAVPTLADQYNGSLNIVQETPNYSNPAAYDAEGNFIITGGFTEDFSFNGATLEAIGSSAYVLKYTGSNEPAWGVALTGAATVTSVTTDNYGNIYVAGQFADEVSFGTTSGDAIVKSGLKNGSAYATTQSAAFIAKYDKNGVVKAVQSFVPAPYKADTYLDYMPGKESVYFRIGKVKAYGDKVYASAVYTGETTVGDAKFIGNYINFFDFAYDENSAGSVFSMDNELATCKNEMIFRCKYDESLYGQECVMSISFDVNSKGVYGGFTGSGAFKVTVGNSISEVDMPGNDNDGFYEVGYVFVASTGQDPVVLRTRTKSMKFDYLGIDDILVDGSNVYGVGTYIGESNGPSYMPVLTLPTGDEGVNPTSSSRVFVSTINASDFSLAGTAVNNVDNAVGTSATDNNAHVASAAVVSNALYLNNVVEDAKGNSVVGVSSYWFDGTSFTEATAGTGVASINGAMVLTNSSDKQMAYNTYTFKKSAISEIEADYDENAPVEYFNLQGVRVANPENGLYIRRQGNKVEKVIVK